MRSVAVPSHCFSVQEYYRLGEVGILAPDARVELLDGEIYDLPPIGPRHAGVETRLQTLLFGATGKRWIVCVQNPVHLDDGSEPVPDLALVRPQANFYTKQHPLPKDVFLLIEVAQSSLQFDRKAKLVAYARAAIPEYWIVNPRAKSVEVHVGPLPAGEYHSEGRCKAGETISPAAFPDLQIAVADLFGLEPIRPPKPARSRKRPAR